MDNYERAQELLGTAPTEAVPFHLPSLTNSVARMLDQAEKRGEDRVRHAIMRVLDEKINELEEAARSAQAEAHGFLHGKTTSLHITDAQRAADCLNRAQEKSFVALVIGNLLGDVACWKATDEEKGTS